MKGNRYIRDSKLLRTVFATTYLVYEKGLQVRIKDVGISETSNPQHTATGGAYSHQNDEPKKHVFPYRVFAIYQIPLGWKTYKNYY